MDQAPLYFSEEIATVGVVLQYLTPVTVFILVLHIAVQGVRILYEEDLLRRNCPGIPDTKRRMWRLILCLVSGSWPASCGHDRYDELHRSNSGTGAKEPIAIAPASEIISDG